MRNALAPLVDAVALFMDNTAEEVRDAIRQVRPTLLQFHGGEDDAFCRGFGVPCVKAIAMGGWLDAESATALQLRYPGRGRVPVRQPCARANPAAAARRSTGAACPPALSKPVCSPGA